MANTVMTYKEVRYIIHPHSIEVYVHIDAHTDVPLGVIGWHYKHFADGTPSPEDTVQERMNAHTIWSIDNISLSNSVLWPQKAP